MPRPNVRRNIIIPRPCYGAEMLDRCTKRKRFPLRMQDEDACCEHCGAEDDIDHSFQCPEHWTAQDKLGAQLGRIFDNTNLRRLDKDKAVEMRRTRSARRARAQRAHRSTWFHTFQDIVDETNRANISAVAASTNSYIRQTRWCI